MGYSRGGGSVYYYTEEIDKKDVKINVVFTAYLDAVHEAALKHLGSEEGSKCAGEGDPNFDDVEFEWAGPNPYSNDQNFVKDFGLNDHLILALPETRQPVETRYHVNYHQATNPNVPEGDPLGGATWDEDKIVNLGQWKVVARGGAMGERQAILADNPAAAIPERRNLKNEDEDTGIVAHGDLDDNKQIKSNIFDHLTQVGKANVPR